MILVRTLHAGCYPQFHQPTHLSAYLPNLTWLTRSKLKSGTHQHPPFELPPTTSVPTYLPTYLLACVEFVWL